MRLRVGTSGYAYKEWKGSFYPADLPDSGMLAFYAGRFGTVEINNTFYRMPTRQLLESWASQVPESFAFALKASRRITHQLQLRDAADPLGYLVDTAATLEGRLGPLLFQLPPHLKKDRELLADFLTLLPPGARAAFEFRHPTWFDDGVYETLAAARAALVVSDQGAEDPPVVPGATFGYARLRREGYDDAALAGWAERFAAPGWEELFVYFKHEESGAGPALAERFSRVFAERRNGGDA